MTVRGDVCFFVQRGLPENKRVQGSPLPAGGFFLLIRTGLWHDRAMTALALGLRYFAGVLAVGFMLGTVRTL